LSSKIIKGVSASSVREIKVLHQRFFEETGLNSSVNHVNDDHAEMLVQARQQMEEELEQARLSFRNWCAEEREKIEQERQKAKEEGFKAGLLQGKEEGMEEMRLQYQDILEEAKQVLEQAYEEKQAIIQEAEPYIVELCTEIAKKVIKQELQSNPDAILSIIKQSLALSNERESIAISVSPADFSFVQNKRQQLLEMVEGQTEIKILPDHSVSEGGCIIRTSYGSIDARINVQLNEIQQALLQVVNQDEAG
jgi:flagellar assembly protein FliH